MTNTSIKQKNNTVAPDMWHVLGSQAWRICAPDSLTFPVKPIEKLLSPIIDHDILDSWLKKVVYSRCTSKPSLSLTAMPSMIETRVRRQDGIFFTPAPVARAMASFIPLVNSGTVVDLASGSGELLCSAIAKHPHLSVWGVEKHPELALAAALSVVETRLSQPGAVRHNVFDKIIVGSGLAELPAESRPVSPVVAVLGNPPYVGEKGNLEEFNKLREHHPHLNQWFVPRMDLLYLFFHRALDYLTPGARLIYLTSEYWLTATGAETLRRDLLTRAELEWFVQFSGKPLFSDAPGHHSLITVARKTQCVEQADSKPRALSLEVHRLQDVENLEERFERLRFDEAHIENVYRVKPSQLSSLRWTPFVPEQIEAWRERWEYQCTDLEALLQDHQGVISGADQVSKRMLRNVDAATVDVCQGEPVFLMQTHNIHPDLQQLKEGVVRPLLKAKDIVANSISVVPPGDTWMLYIDEALSTSNEQYLTNYLQRFRPWLEKRREVASGKMPWYRLHWPRQRAHQVGPKLVVPRRAQTPCFALDLSASVISSDCTYLVAPEAVREPVRYLTALMLLLNSEEIAQYLSCFGKKKGKLIEFYAQPLRRLPIAATLEDGRLVLSTHHYCETQRNQFWSRVDDLISKAVGKPHTMRSDSD